MVREALVDDEDLEEVRLFESSTDGEDAKVLDLMHLDEVWVLHLREWLQELNFLYLTVEMVGRLEADDTKPKECVGSVHNLAACR